MLHDKQKVPKLCPRCQKKFVCDEAEGCWCERVFLTKENLSFLRTRYVDCLCKHCLDSFGPAKN